MPHKITAVQISYELSEFNEGGKLLPRPPNQVAVAFEAEIPEPVMEWLYDRLRKGGA